MSKITTSRLVAFSDGVIAIIVTNHGVATHHSGAANVPCRAETGSHLSQLRTELSHGGDYVGESPSSRARRSARDGSPAMVEPEPAVLDVIDPVRDGLPGPQPESIISSVAVRGRFDLCGFAFWVLRWEIARQHQHDPEMSEYHSRMQLKNLFSAFLYLTAAAVAHISIYIAYLIYVLIPATLFSCPRRNWPQTQIRASKARCAGSFTPNRGPRALGVGKPYGADLC
jgi:hypothetical protein